MKGYQTPDIIFPSSNEYGIPDLDFALQGEYTTDMQKWGDTARTKPHAGTFHFYTEDYKFEALWKNPEQLVNTHCQSVIEPNFSTGERTPKAVFLWDLYRKRWLSKYWQTQWIRIWVDLNVEPCFYADCLWGVPQGWLSYATRGLDRRWQDLQHEYLLAKQHAGQEPLFLVYGGGRLVRQLCLEQGWLHVRENMHLKSGYRPEFQLRILELV